MARKESTKPRGSADAQSEIDIVVDWLWTIPDTGESGFDGLVVALLEQLTERPWHLARSGSQFGRDGGTGYSNGSIRACVECKRYKPPSTLDETELLGKLVEATPAGRHVDIWILAVTRDVSDQLASKLALEAESRGVALGILDAPSNRVGRLVALVARHPAVLLEGPRNWRPPRKVEIALSRIRSRTDFETAQQQLVESLGPSEFGFAAVRDRIARDFEMRLSDEVSSRALFGQVVTPRLVPIADRKQVVQEFASWWESWSSNRVPLVVHGKEGTGKTWAVASWLGTLLSSGQEAPIVLWCSSRNFAGQEFVDLLGALISRLLPQHNPGNWKRRLQNWSSKMGQHPRVLFVLDGIDEIAENRWRPWLSDALYALRDDYKGIALVLTTRTAKFRDLNSRLGQSDRGTRAGDLLLPSSDSAPPQGRDEEARTSTSVEITDFEDSELSALLASQCLGEWEPPPGVRKLMRRPKYFARALRQSSRLAEIGDPTEERLLWEDLKARRAERDRVQISDLDFESLLLAFARNFRSAHFPKRRGLERSSVSEALRAISDVESALADLTSSELLLTEPGFPNRLNLNPERMPHAIGLLLLETAATESPAGIDHAVSIIEKEIEEIGDGDLSSAAVAFAVCAALATEENDQLPTEVVVTLLHALARMRNGGNIWDKAKPWSFFPLRPEVFFFLAEAEWRLENLDHAARARISYCFAHIAEKWPEHPDLVQACERWLSFVHPSEHRYRKVEDPTRLDRLREVEEHLPGRARVQQVDTVQLLDLAYIALMVASHSKSASYLTGLVSLVIGRSLSKEFFEISSVEWLTRMAFDSLRSGLSQRALELARASARPLQEAAAQLLRLEGSASSLTFAETIDPTDPDRYWSFAPPEVVDSPSQAREVAFHLASDAHDPERQLQFSHAALALSDLSTEELCRGFETTFDQIELERIFPTLCRVNFQVLADFKLRVVRSWLEGAATGDKLRRYHSVASDFLLFGEQELQKIREVARAGWGVEEERLGLGREWELTGIALASLIEARHQMSMLLERPDSEDSREWIELFAPLDGDDAARIIESLLLASPRERLRRILFPWPRDLSLSDSQREILWKVMQGGDLKIFGCAPAIRTGDKELFRRAATSGMFCEDHLSAVLQSNQELRGALEDLSQDRTLGVASRSWLLESKGLTAEFVSAWVSEVDQRLSNPPAHTQVRLPDSYSVEVLELAVSVEPQVVGRWIQGVLTQSGLGHRLNDVEFGLLEALIVALVNRDDPRVLDLVGELRPGNYFLRRWDSVLGLPFRCKRTEMARRLLGRLLALATTDDLLFEIAREAAERGEANWLREVAEGTHLGDRRWEVARTLTLVGLGVGSPEAVDYAARSGESDESWVRGVATWSQYNLRRDLWGRFWFRRFLETPDRAEAWAAYQLFESNKPGMCGVWIRDELDRARNGSDFEVRRRHLVLNLPRLNKLLETQRKSLSKSLFGFEVPSSDLQPWKEKWRLN